MTTQVSNASGVDKLAGTADNLVKGASDLGGGSLVLKIILQVIAIPVFV